MARKPEMSMMAIRMTSSQEMGMARGSFGGRTVSRFPAMKHKWPLSAIVEAFAGEIVAGPPDLHPRRAKKRHKLVQLRQRQEAHVPGLALPFAGRNETTALANPSLAASLRR